MKRVRAKGKTFERSGSEFEFMIDLNGTKVGAILDTRSPISILPTSYTKTVKPKKVIRSQTAQKFVDVNGRPIPIMNRYKQNTDINGIETSAIWCEVETNTKPIIGMDNFDRLGLKVNQRETERKNELRTTKTKSPSSKRILRVKDSPSTKKVEATKRKIDQAVSQAIQL